MIPSTPTLPNQTRTYGVLDVFGRPTVDVNGDGIKDVAHGLFIERLIKGLDPQADVVRFQLQEGETPRADYAPDNVETGFKQVCDYLQSGQSLDALNVSIVHNDSFFKLNGQPKTQTPTNIHTMTDELRREIDGQRPHYYQVLSSMLGQLQQLIQQAPELGIFTGAGNDGTKEYNTMSLIDGVTTVGALDLTGQKPSYTGDNTLVSSFEQGDYLVRRVAGGYDITGDDTPEFMDEEISNGTPMVDAFQGKSLAELTQADAINTPDTFDHIHAEALEKRVSDKVKTGLIPINEALMDNVLRELPWSNVDVLGELSRFGDYVSMNIGRDKAMVFRKDTNDRLWFDPQNTGERQAVNIISGTSFAAPTAMIKSQN